ncbi:hypothetical protein G7046_g2570 [Stylonectria norvegica]|nr:hypothetical protein G7046_g2570 [Stylonectria norvegica]
MTPSRLLHHCSFSATSRFLFLARGHHAPFSTSTVLGIRQRPGRRVPVRSPTDAVPRVALEGSGLVSRVVEETGSAVLAGRQKSGLPLSIGDKSDPKPAARKPRKPKPLVVKGMKTHHQSLYQQESICYEQGAKSPTQLLRRENPALEAAGVFFEHGCRFLYSAESLYDHTRNDHIPEIVVLGASNAGKSSFLNALVGEMDTARVSQRPGRTTTMNAYGVGPRPKIARELVRKGDPPPKHSIILMDTPGYGFRSQSDWGQTILKYLEMRKMLRGAVVLIPADKKLQTMDKWMLKTLAQSNTRTLVVLTKADKNGVAWVDSCNILTAKVQREMKKIGAAAAKGWREGSEGAAGVYVTAANMDITAKLGNGGGLGGVRQAILEMAGFSLQQKVEKQPETAVYTGPVVSFDDIKWKA